MKRWFREAQYGMMVHWGLYSLLGGEWKGKVMDNCYLAEWIQQYYRIPIAEYEKLAAVFNPVFFDADEWVCLARDAGMKYIVLTSKHHDGFAMFRSKASRYNIVDATPFRRDPIEELAEACRKHGLKLGLYYSQDLDWHERGGGGYKMGNSTVRRLQPGCLVNSRIGGGSCNGINRRIVCDYTSSGDNEIPRNLADRKGMLYETCATINDTWGYKPADQNWKSAETIRKNREHLKSIGANYLLNVGPDGLGRIPARSAQILREAQS